MAKELNTNEQNKLIETSLKKIQTYLTELQTINPNKENKKRAILIARWLSDYISLIREEKNFDSKKLLKYNRGDVVSVNFGFRIGSELGGIHFAMVLDNYNSQKSPILTVIPLTSLKGDYNDTCFTHLLEKGIYDLQQEKFNKIIAECNTSLSDLKVLEKQIGVSDEASEMFSKKISILYKKIEQAKTIRQKISNLKTGSVINLGHIITISKQRILNPKYSSDTLNQMKISPKDLDIINEKIAYLYLHKNGKKAKDSTDLITPFVKGLENQE